MKEHEFIAVGDIVTDAFIRLQTATIDQDASGEHSTITMPFGDKIPYESVEIVRAVGNSANATVSAARLGLSSSLIANIGGDENGRECLAALEANKVNIDYIKINKDKETNYHYVLWFKDDRTILVKHQKYEYALPEKIHKPTWLYLSSLGDNTLEYHNEIVRYLEQHPDVSLAFQPGTYQMNFGTEALRGIYDRTKIFFCNIQEAERILKIPTLGTKELLKRLHDIGPEIVVLTDGSRGAYTYDGTTYLFLPTYPDIAPPVERTGAGDAFASTTVASLALGFDLPTSLMHGAINSMSVVQHVGAQKGLLSMEKIEEYMKTAPSDFKPRELE
ncbi:carbohydrate kinase family protein [soil metagenome]